MAVIKPLSPRCARKRSSAAALAAGLLLLSACSSEPEAPQAVSTPVEGVRVELISAGKSPQEPLAWFADDGEQSVTYSASQGLEQRTKNAPAKDKNGKDDIPYGDVTMDLPLTATTESDGTSHTQVVKVGKPDGSNAQLNDEMASAEDFTMSTTMDDDGRATDREFSAPENATDGARASVETALTQMTDLPIIFPKEPMGIGAKWKVSNRVDEAISLQQDITYELKARHGKNVTLAVEIKRRPAVSSLADTDLKVLHVDSDSQGQLQLDLTRPLPVRGQVSVDTTITYGKEKSPLRVIQKATSRSKWD